MFQQEVRSTVSSATESMYDESWEETTGLSDMVPWTKASLVGKPLWVGSGENGRGGIGDSESTIELSFDANYESVAEVGCGVNMLYRNPAACFYAIGNDSVEGKIDGREWGTIAGVIPLSV